MIDGANSSSLQKRSFILAVKNVSLEVNPLEGCGGGETEVQIQIIIDKDDCTTAPLQFPTGQTVSWITDDELKDCSQEKKFSADAESITFKVLPTDKNEGYCINSLSLVLDDENNTSYMINTGTKWRHGNETFTKIINTPQLKDMSSFIFFVRK